MPNKHFYFAMGAASGFLLILALQFLNRKKRSLQRPCGQRCFFGYQLRVHIPILLPIFGCIALVPDALYLFNILPKDIVRSDVFNLFWGYSWFEWIEDKYPAFDHVLNVLGMLTIYFLALTVFGFYIRECKKRVQQKGFD